ncbi:hypothetical protein [Streptomyces sp. MJP52]|uniref:hypothetical protein n=1 Tax=Streptomyces sp. MJP52 TaxID=2940555 RepID=UPI002474D1EF|nr:hypothetical protein [Streptomyces sp. MJP52]MDH6224309.1 hypothetical protein [Streptomyces sp. MJP52]
MTQLQFSIPVPGTVDPAAGQAAKADGMAAAEAATPITWAAACQNGIAEMARRGTPFQAADLVREGLVDEPEHPAMWGPQFGIAAKAGVIEHAGYVRSKRATVKSSICQQWIGTAAYRTAAAS